MFPVFRYVHPHLPNHRRRPSLQPWRRCTCAPRWTRPRPRRRHGPKWSPDHLNKYINLLSQGKRRTEIICCHMSSPTKCVSWRRYLDAPVLHHLVGKAVAHSKQACEDKCPHKISCHCCFALNDCFSITVVTYVYVCALSKR